MGYEARVSIDMQALAARMREALDQAVERITASMAERARALAPSRTGRLRQGIKAESGTLVSSAPYSSFLHEGTGLYGPLKRAYYIRPKKAKALWWKGAPHPCASVLHKGIRQRDFLRQAVEGEHIVLAFEAAFLESISGR